MQRNAIAKAAFSAVNSEQVPGQDASEYADCKGQGEGACDDDPECCWVSKPIGVDPCHRVLRGRDQETDGSVRTVLYGRA